MSEATLGNWAPEDLVMVSALEHYSYCPRQCALIHVEQVFDENVYTMRGRRLHERVDEPCANQEGGVRIERALPIWSERLGLIGKADVVEFYGNTPYPVEYKHGPRRKHRHDDLQLCAQAICLEEMTGQAVPKGAIFHHSSRRRREVVFSVELRDKVAKTVDAVRKMLKEPRLPPPFNDERCPNCSLINSCLPGAVAERKRLKALRAQLFKVHDS
ncbi:MAG: CRISPR-associated protein Cas4 [Ammonifex sp.]|jgi:CRISPR-associated exonuclease Cas4|nr:MAG: CRISPR-associated protein Cas4 [Ammonifex sp.]